MDRLQGKSISPGCASGIALVLQTRIAVPRRRILDTEVSQECSRLQQAIGRAAGELSEIRERVVKDFDRSHSRIFEAHLSMLKDPVFIAGVESRIRSDLINAEQAIDLEIRDICDRLGDSGNRYLKERQKDIVDIGRRVIGCLMSYSLPTLSNLPPRTVLVAHELLPSDTVYLDRSDLAAILTEEGGQTSHTAILARALGVPCITAVKHLLKTVATGTELLVNGDTGEVIVAPSMIESLKFSQQVRKQVELRAIKDASERLPCITADGVAVNLHANVSRPPDCSQVAIHHLDGIGLLRTEFLFLDSNEPPSVDFQSLVYQMIAESIPGKPLVIRTLDMAPDKQPNFLEEEFCDQTPCFRGLRFSLREQRLFDDQIAASARVAKNHDVRLLFPMVIDPQDVVRAIEIVNHWSQHFQLSTRPAVGVMVETPAAVILIERLLKLVDFVSIGTNDLTQYMLVTDRTAVDFDSDYSIFHPAVLRAIHEITKKSLSAGKPVSVCGEAAGDPIAACLLAGLGIRQLSMSPIRAADVRQILRLNRMSNLQTLGQEAIQCSTTADVRQLTKSIVRPAR